MMKALSLWQPWASFMDLGYKTNETRSWATNYRGPLIIHAAKNITAVKDADDILEEGGIDMSKRSVVAGTQWPRGVILCVVDLIDCVPTEKIRDGLTQLERAMGDYSDGRFAWMTKHVRRIKPAIPYRGMQGLFTIPDEVMMTARLG